MEPTKTQAVFLGRMAGCPPVHLELGFAAVEGLPRRARQIDQPGATVG
ncbi:MAG: hypothetical protein ACXVBO_08360 [Isosphaeraceae bacterium]